MPYPNLFLLHSEPDQLNGFKDRYKITPMHIVSSMLFSGKADEVSERQLKIIINHPDILNIYIQTIRRPLSDDMEDIIARNAWLSIAYVKTCLYRPFPKAEHMLNMNSKYWEMYVEFLRDHKCRPVYQFINNKEFRYGFAERNVSD